MDLTLFAIALRTCNSNATLPSLPTTNHCVKDHAVTGLVSTCDFTPGKRTVGEENGGPGLGRTFQRMRLNYALPCFIKYTNVSPKKSEAIQLEFQGNL